LYPGIENYDINVNVNFGHTLFTVKDFHLEGFIQVLNVIGIIPISFILLQNVSSFDELLALVGPSIARQDTNFRTSVPEAEQLSLPLR
jgi:hypothetical protein